MAYNGRRGPNVSEYIANLNAIPSEQDLQGQDDLNFDDDLALFTNTNFFDWDLGQNADLQPSLDPSAGHQAGEGLDMKPLEFEQGDFSFTDFNFNAAQPMAFDSTSQLTPAPITKQPLYTTSSTPGSPPSLDTTISTGTKRKASEASPSPDSLEDSSRAAAEEDKRRRNTAASARFRVKKKQREQALEKSAKEMNDKVAALEGRINQLETENKWLKNLVTEKAESKEDIAALWKKYSAESDRKGSERKDGVGTKA